MKKLALTTFAFGLLTLAFAFGFAGSANAAAADVDTVAAAWTADLLDDEARPARHPILHRLLRRAGRSMVRAVRAECDCGDVKCAEKALKDRQKEIIKKLPQRCDNDCRKRVDEALDKLAERILLRVENANCDPAGGEPGRP
jgi:hypothetical protein